MNDTHDESTCRATIGGTAVDRLVAEFGTPTYVYDLSVIRQRVEELRAFDCIRYAQKALSNIAILDRLRQWGVRVDAVSAGEVARAIAAGFLPQADPPEIVFTADILDRHALDVVARFNLHVNCGSPDMIDQVARASPGASVTLRVNPGFGHGHSQKTNTGGASSKHGIWFDQLDECRQRAEAQNVTITGLHMHIGSGTDLEHLSKVCAAMENAAASFEALEVISAGGGLPVPRRPDDPRIDLASYFELWNATRIRLQSQLNRSLRLEIEPGRYLVAESGYLVTEIRAIKQMGENLFYLVDAGFNDLARPILYGAYHPISICHRSGIQSDELVDVIVGGPLCESGDIFTQEEGGMVAKRQLPPADVGDFLILEQAGAYGFSMASNYNSKPRAAEVLLEEGQAKLIRSRETIEDLMRGEIIPDSRQL